MFTSNYIEFLNNYLFKNWFSNGYNFTLKDFEGNTRNEKMEAGQYVSQSSGYIDSAFFNVLRANQLIETPQFSYNNGYLSMNLGRGTTPETVNDYNLESLITEGLSSVSSSIGKTVHGTLYTASFGNTSNEDITINEVGLYMICQNRNAKIDNIHNGPGWCALFYRKVLDSPVILVPGQVAIFSIEMVNM